ncbi:FadD3 family acyl-CoA ligase [Williamsia deligens]|uniref:FadD3 family acyl-CoA ligase n=1 Tax=Williamsia deligens TaxID=321325 RepID=A0ABW3G785_9NOCA|nr:FadD3 family acyl-CoA ligase [Williamsia deligens]MCP2194324.1 Acyl-CoA synthetase (AMP-forming)/AMP-acid ligase II [Williamsia deligens]
MTDDAQVGSADVDTIETTPAALRRAAALWPDAVAVVDEQWGEPTRLTWSQLLDAVRTAAGVLVTLGVGAGDRVAVWAPNCAQWPVAALAVHWAGAVLVPLNTRYTAIEVVDVLARIDARVLVVSGTFLGTDRLADLLALDEWAALTAPPTPVRVRLDPDVRAGTDRSQQSALDWDDLLTDATDDARAEADRRADAVAPDDLSDILFTSGTTGRSKGVMAEHRQTLAGARAWGANGRLRTDDRYLMVNPYFHTFGYKAGILPCVLFGTAMYPLAVYDTTAAMDLVETHRLTVFPGAPTIFQTILDDPGRTGRDLTSLRLVVTGAAIVPVVLVERIQRDLGVDTVITAYGLTECSGFVSTCTPDDDDVTVAGTCGRAFAGMEIALSEAGEVLARGAMVMRGYLDDPAATAETVDADGWLHTGDIGTIDDAGNLRITDRLKDMYISGGFNVYPAEVEQTLARLPEVTEAAVIGVPDDRLGEVGAAFVTLRPGTELDADAVIAFCRTRLAAFKVPRTVVAVDAFPRNASGKILKRELR